MQEKEVTFKAEKVKAAIAGEVYNLEALEASEPCFIVRDYTEALQLEECGYNALAIQLIENLNPVLWKIKNRKNRSGVIVALYNDRALQTEDEARRWKTAADTIYKTATQKKSACHVIDADITAASADQMSAAVKALVTDFVNKSSVASYGMKNFIAELEEDAASNSILTGFSDLDRILGGRGILPGLFTIGAEPGAGKTAFCMQIADQVASRGRSVIVYAMEMTASQLIARSISRYTYIEAKKKETKAHRENQDWIPNGAQTALEVLQRDKWTDTTFEAADQYFNSIGNHLYIREARGMTAEDICGEVALWVQATGEKPLVIIDYLQLIKPTDEKLTATQATAAATQTILDLARSNKVAVLLVSAFNRSSYDGTNGKSSFRDASDIEYSSETAALLQNIDVLEAVNNAGATQDKQRKAADDARRKGGRKRRIRLLLVKSRHSAEYGSIDFNFYGGYSLFIPSEAQDNTVML